MKKIFISLLIAMLLIFITFTATCTPQTIKQTQTKSTNIQYYFTRENQHPDVQLIKVIDSAKSNLDIAIYSLTKKSIVDSIIQAESRGVTCKIITDKIESKTKSEKKMLILLEKANIPIKINSHSGLMHMKVTVADDKIVITGSYNYTEGATKVNDEVLMIINDNKIAQGFDNEFNIMWNDNKEYKDYK